jgi:regulator of protease activity HflC (stomatin/prohibitin superfamily)
LESEAQMEFDSNIAEGKKTAVIKNSEAQMNEEKNLAMGGAFSIIERAKAQAQAIEIIAAAIQSSNGEKAVQYQIAKDYVQQFGKLAQKNNTLILPSNVGDISGMVAQAMTVFNSFKGKGNESNMTKSEALEELTKEVSKDKKLVSKLTK